MHLWKNSQELNFYHIQMQTYFQMLKLTKFKKNIMLELLSFDTKKGQIYSHS